MAKHVSHLQSKKGRSYNEGVFRRMTGRLTLEEGEEDTKGRCACCGREARSVHGFVFRNEDAYAVYYAGWSEGHHEDGVSMAIATGEWDDDSDAKSRVSIGIRAKVSGKRIEFTVLDPEQSPWGSSVLLGEMVPRNEALHHRSIKQFFELAELVARDDLRVKRFLNQLS